MKRFRRYFDRELDFLARLRRGALGWLRPLFGNVRPEERPLPGAARRGRGGVPATRRRPPAVARDVRSRRARNAAPRRPARGLRRRIREARTPAAGILLSLLLHVVLVTLLAALLPARRTAAGRVTERWITIRLVPPREVSRKPETRTPPRPGPSVPRPRPRTDPVVQTETPTRPVEHSSPGPAPTPRDPAALSALADLQPPPLPSRSRPEPSTIGVGARSPPSGSGKGAALFANRGSGREHALRLWGGSRGTEDAVARGLAWLAAHQDSDGTWDADGFNRHCVHFSHCFGTGGEEFDVAISALAVLAFLGAGHSPCSSSPYRDVVDRGLRFLLRSQDASGRFGPVSERFLYNHGIATFALAEAHGICGGDEYLGSATRGLAYSARVQQAGGGWDYTDQPTGRNDLSITGWQIMAIHAALHLDIPVPREMVERARGYLDSCVSHDGQAVYANRGIGEGRRGVNMAAVGMLCRLYLGVPSRDSAIQAAARYVLRNPPDVEKTYQWDRHYQSAYYWYYATLGLFHLGGQRWEGWNHFIKKTILPLQSRKPHEEGSWGPDGNWIGASGGRIASTALQVLTLEVYYRYPPLHAYRKD